MHVNTFNNYNPFASTVSSLSSPAYAAATKVVSSVTDSAIYLQDKTIAQWVAMNKVVEMRLAKKLPKEGKSNGEDEMAGRSWRWDILVKNTAYPKLREVEVGVKPASEDSDSPPTVVVTSLLGEL